MADQWHEAVDPATKKTYYYNKVTKQTSWTKPAELMSKPDDVESNPANWSETVDPNTKRTYYYNRISKKTSWQKPPALKKIEDEKAAKEKAEKEKAEKAEQERRAQAEAAAAAAAAAASAAAMAAASAAASASASAPIQDTAMATASQPAQPAQASQASQEPQQQPAAAAAKPKSPSDQWAQATDPKTGRKYWYNRVTKETSWKDPRPPALIAATTNAAGAAPAAAAAPAAVAATPSTSSTAAPLTRTESQGDTSSSNTSNPEKRQEDSDKDEEDEKDSDDEDGGRKKGKGAKGGATASSDDGAGATSGHGKSVGSAAEGSKANLSHQPSVSANLGGAAASAAGGEYDAQRASATVDKKKANQVRTGEDPKGGKESDEEDDTHDVLKFAQHRHGLFNRLLRRGDAFDEARLLSFKKSLIKKALLKQNRELDAEAVQAFKNVMSYMGDRKSSKKPIDHARKLIMNLMVAPAGLRDEVYMQICKQTTLNPRMESTVKGWELMSFCLCTFPPSKHLRTFLTEFINKNIADTGKPKIVEMAQLCAERLNGIVKLGQRKQVPSKLELECLQENRAVPVKVGLVNDTFKTFTVDSFTFVKDVNESLAKKFNLVCDAPFALYETADHNVERLLDPKDRILDVMAAWENQEKDEKDKEKDKAKAEKAAVVASKAPKYNAFVYKAKLVLKTSDPEIMADSEAVNMLYIQAVHDVITWRYPVNEKDITVLAALQLQATYGNYKEDVHSDAWLISKIDEIMPQHLLSKKGKSKKDEKLLKEWAQKILAKYMKVSGFTAQEAKLNYLDYVQEWTFYGATFFTVEQRQFKDYPSPLTLGITCEGVLLMHPEKRTVLENYQFTDIVTWGHSDEKFIIVVGNIVQQRKLIFKTSEGKAMNHLIHDYVKFKVKSKPATAAS